jgi:hypothetical protein
MSAHTCQCQGAGDCSILGRSVSLREYELCSGKCPAERPCDDGYRLRWIARHHGAAPQSPGMIEKLGHFAEAFLKHAATGFAHVEEAEYQQRLAICEACPKLQAGVCTQCGCATAGKVLAKARWASESCPLGKWPALPHGAAPVALSQPEALS